MSISIVGAKIVEIQEKQFFNCIIRKIVCHHSDDKKAVLYSYEKAKAELVKADKERRQDELKASEKTYAHFCCSISKIGVAQYYFISNYNGKSIELECIREVNSCTEENHNFYKIDYEDKKSRAPRSDRHNVADSKLKLYYYDLFYRARAFAKSTSEHIAIMTVVPDAIVGAYGAGSILDYLFALRFIHLPLIKENDNEYYCHVSLYYNECPHDVHILPINIQIYPDIEYNLELGIKISRKYKGDRTENDGFEKSSSVKFTIKYNDVEKEISFENVDENEIEARSKDKKGTLFYKMIGALREIFKGMHQFTKKFRELIEEPLGKQNSIVKDTKSLQTGAYRLASRRLSWLVGSLELEPSLSLNWRYYVPDDLSRIRRFFELEFGLKGNGTMTIDLIELGRTVLNKTKKTATTVAVVVSVGSGGIAALPAVLVSALVSGLITMVTNWLRKPFKAELIFSCNAELTPIKFNNLENENFETSLKIEPTAKLNLAMEGKTSFIILSTCIELEFEGKVYAEASISAPIEFILKSKKDGLSLEIKAEISPFKVGVGYMVAGSYNISKKWTKNKETDKKQVNAKSSCSWEFGGCKMEPVQFVFFENEDNEYNTTGQGQSGGGGAIGSW